MQNLKDVKFQRNYRAEFEIGHFFSDFEEFIADEKITITYPITLVLNIDSGFGNSSNAGVFQFYNLSKQTQARLWLDEYNIGKKYIKMRLYAGYQDTMPLVFEGFLSRCISYRSEGSVDWITNINAFDGGALFRYGYVNMCVSQDTKLVDLVNYMTEKYGVKPGYITDKIPPLAKNRTFIGQTMDILGREYGGYDIYIDKGELNILGNNEIVKGDILVISNETGLLGSPKRANLYTEVDLIFEPRLRLRQAVSLYSRDLPDFNDLYEVVKVVHKGIISPVICDKLTTHATLSLFPTEEPTEVKKAVPSTYGGTPTKGKWDKPVEGRVSSSYGWRMHPTKHVKKFHYGIDIAAPLNTPVKAPANGKVKITYINGSLTSGYGRMVIIDHGKINGKHVTSRYAHLNKWVVTPQQEVYKGQKIALMGNTGNVTGPHLHFEIIEDGHFVNPIQYIGSY